MSCTVDRVEEFLCPPAPAQISPKVEAFHGTVQNNNFMDLPNEIIGKIFTTVSDRDLCKLSSTNRRWNAITASLLDTKWKKLGRAILQLFSYSQKCTHNACREAFHSANSEATTSTSQRMNRFLQSLKIIDSKEIAQMVKECPELQSLFYNPLSFLHNLLFDLPLTVVWQKLKEQNCRLHLPDLRTAKAIRQWIQTKEAKRSRIKRLDLSHCNLFVLPPEIGELATLKELRLQRNPHTSFLIEIGQSLKVLRFLLPLSRAFPTKTGQLTALKELNLMRNKLTSLPHQIGQLTSLQVLRLGENQLTSLPPEIGQLTSLKALRLKGNQLSSLPPEVGQLTSLKVLSLGGNQLTSLPATIGQLASLKELCLIWNKLSSLPHQIGQLASLQVLHLGENKLTFLPPEVGQLTSLKELNLTRNQLTYLPSEIGQLTALQVLRLGENKLTSLPPAVGQLASLQTLFLEKNQLTSLPPEVGQLTSLKMLDIRKNPQLAPLPAKIERKEYNLKLYILRVDEDAMFADAYWPVYWP